MTSAPHPAGESRNLLLIVDDDRLISGSLAFALGTDFDVRTAESRAQAIELVREMPAPPAAALVDLGLPPFPHRPDEGFLLITALLAHSPEMKILVLSGQNEDANARHARALGAVEFIPKPCDPDTLRRALAGALSLGGTDTAAAAALIGRSSALARLREQITQFADSPFPVLIEGESGSGKERVAEGLHRQSRRSAQPILALNCAAITPTLVEPTLFGYVKGAFTGATANRAGYFEDADEGTLFLDEIGELPLDMQAKLLRVLENGEYQRVGETQSRRSGARVIAATNRDLREEVRGGRFRGDLFHRLSVLTLSVPPLRDMEDDRLLLLEHFRAHYAARGGLAPFTLDADALRRWGQYDFPGNVRELRNIVIRLATKYPGKLVSRDELEAELDPDPGRAQPPDDFAARAQCELESGAGDFNLDRTLERWERAYVDAALRLARGNMSQAARLLGVNRTTLYGRMQTGESQAQMSLGFGRPRGPAVAEKPRSR